MLNLFRLLLVFAISICVQQPAFAALDLELTQGVANQLPIAIVPFTGQDNASAPNNVSGVITNDLKNSGQFKVMDTQSMSQQPHQSTEVNDSYWRGAGVDSLVVGNVTSVGGDRYKVKFALVNVVKGEDVGGNPILASNEFTVSGSDLRKLAHHISDVIYQKLTGVRGVFSTRVVYVLVQHGGHGKNNYALQIADVDGYNPKVLLSSDQPIMSPAWSHDGKRIAYVSFEKVTPRIYVQEIASGSRRVVSESTGINGAPAWSPDNNRLAMVLSKNGSPKIYVMNLASGQTQQVTDGNSIDTEPNWSPDGKTMLFTSDRGGGPQIYQMNVGGGDAHRVTFNGSYNARASFSPDGKNIVMINREQGMYNIALQDLSSGNVQVLTQSGYDASPSFAPNGRMVLYESNPGQQGMLGIVSVDGRVKLRVPAPGGSVQDPAWSPFLP